jgi:hypothetical protein
MAKNSFACNSPPAAVSIGEITERCIVALDQFCATPAAAGVCSAIEFAIQDLHVAMSTSASGDEDKRDT